MPPPPPYPLALRAKVLRYAVCPPHTVTGHLAMPLLLSTTVVCYVICAGMYNCLNYAFMNFNIS